MNIGLFYAEERIQLPLSWNDSQYFLPFLESKFAEYSALLDQLAEPATLVQKVMEDRPATDYFCARTVAAVKAMLHGQPSDAYQEFAEGLRKLVPILDRITLTDLGPGDLRFVYRVRKQTGPPLTREEMFHIPFEKRQKVASQRYSIPGLPCLYLCGSLYTCWAEMGQPPFHELQASAFWLKDGCTIKLINLSERPLRMQLRLTPEGHLQDAASEDLFVTHVLLWPLFAACSIRVRVRAEPFKPEYIIPQMLLQWVAKEGDFDGICYFSTHVNAVTRRPVLPPCNLVFPAREIKEVGRCSRLRGHFKMTQPYSWELLRAITVDDETRFHLVPTYEFEFINGRKQQYFRTEFGIVESRLNKMADDIRIKNKNREPELGDVAE